MKMTYTWLEIWDQISGGAHGPKIASQNSLFPTPELRCWVMPWEIANIVHGNIWTVKGGRTKNELLKWIKDEGWKSLGHLLS